LSTPSTTATFVSGDRVRYKYSGKTYTGTIIEPYDRIEGWYSLTLEKYGDVTFFLPGENMIKIDLPPISTESLIKHYEIREREMPQWIARRLEEEILDWSEYAAEHRGDEMVDSFDAGYISGLRKGIQIAEELTSKLTKYAEQSQVAD
jgi:hypothetical protein